MCRDVFRPGFPRGFGARTGSPASPPSSMAATSVPVRLHFVQGFRPSFPRASGGGDDGIKLTLDGDDAGRMISIVG
jgi:hypothetical protein